MCSGDGSQRGWCRMKEDRAHRIRSQKGEGRMCGTQSKPVFYSECKEELAIRRVLTKRACVTAEVQRE